MTEYSYQQFCLLAKTSEVLGGRWTILLLSELLAGSTRFNDLRRAVPRMSPALLSKRLKELEESGILEKVPLAKDPGVMEYRPTPSGLELKPILEAMAVWGHRWEGVEPQLGKLDAGLLMWNMRRKVMVDKLPQRRVVIQFMFPEQHEGENNYWFLIDPETGADLCCIDPGFDVDLYVRTDLRTMTAVYMGMESYAAAVEDGKLLLIGDSGLEKDMLSWLRLSRFACVEKQVA